MIALSLNPYSSMFSWIWSFKNVLKIQPIFKAIISGFQTFIKTFIGYINFYIERLTENNLELPPYFWASV